MQILEIILLYCFVIVLVALIIEKPFTTNSDILSTFSKSDCAKIKVGKSSIINNLYFIMFILKF